MSKSNQKNFGFIVAENEQQARGKAIEKFPELKNKSFKLRQDEDCLDTWFSSWLWTISVFDGINKPDNEEINYYYPTNDLVTAPEIIFFWVARMIMAGYEYRGKECFKNVYFTGIVRDKLGRKMSKSLGNSPDPIALIEKYGADGVRMGMLLSSPAGNDLPFDESLCEQGRNFCNKIWNAFRLVNNWNTEEMNIEPQDVTVKWFNAVLQKTISEIDNLFSKYKLSEALTLIYKVFWDDFCSWYLEIIKPEYGKPIDTGHYYYTTVFFEDLLKLLHPFMPFITEELYHNFNHRERDARESIMFAKFSDIDLQKSPQEADKRISDFEKIKEIISNIRNIRASKNISPKEKLHLQVVGEHNNECNEVILKLANLEKIEIANTKSEDTLSFMVGTCEYAILVGNLINTEEEIAKVEKEIAHLEGFLKSVKAKLSNEKFVVNARPEVVENERKKKYDAETKLTTLKQTLTKLQAK